MSNLKTVDKIQAALGGLGLGPNPGAPASGPPPGYVASGFGYKKAPAPPAKKSSAPKNFKTVTLPNVAAPTTVPFFNLARRGPQRDTADVFATDQAAAEAYYKGAPGYGVGPEFSYLTHGSESDMTLPLAQLAQDKKHAARIRFVDWLKTDQPDIYAEVVNAIQSGAVGEAQDTAPKTSLWDKILGGVTSALSTIAGAKMQQDILKTNISRANQGLPPIDAASYAPVVRTEVAITPEMAADLRAGALGISKNVLLWGGALAAAWLLLKK